MRASTCVLPAAQRSVPHRRPTGGRARRRAAARVVVARATRASKNDDGEKRTSRPPLHVHVGAGKLAMGLVIPSLLESDVPTVMLQTTRAPWNGVRASAARQTRSFDESRLHMSVQHRNKPIQSARLIFDDASAVAFASSKLDDKSSLNENTFIISDDFANVWAPIIRAATSVSTAVGPALVDWLGRDVLMNALPMNAVESNAVPMNVGRKHEPNDDDKIVASTELTKVYCCENDHDAVHSLAQLLEGRAEVIPVVVDKVCSSLKVEGPEDEDPEEGTSSRLAARRRWTAFVSTEPFPGLILPLSGSNANDPFLPFDAKKNHGETFRVARDVKVAKFLHAKKLSQVNGVHTCLAFVALLASPIRDFNGLYAVESLNDVSLKSLESVSQPLADSIWTWAVAESLAVVAAHDADVAADAVTHPHLTEKSHSGVDITKLSLKELRQFEDARYTYAARRVLRDARESLGRLSGSARDDSVGRVLNAGVLLRLEGRMRTTRDTVRGLAQKLESDVAMHGVMNGDNLRRALGPVAAALVRESGFENLDALRRATDATYAAAASVAAFVTAGAEANEAARNNAVTRPAWASETAETAGEDAAEKKR
jgi:hypothetical protein